MDQIVQRLCRQGNRGGKSEETNDGGIHGVSSEVWQQAIEEK